jgi:transposase-like protein
VNVLDRVPKKLQGEAGALVTPIPYANTLEEAERLKKKFQSWAKEKELLKAGELLDQDWERMVSFYRFPKEHWKHIRTTNPVESPFAAVRLRTSAAKRFKKIENATAVIWKVLLVAQKRFRRLDAPHLLADVADGRKFENGMAVKGKKKQEGKAA